MAMDDELKRLRKKPMKDLTVEESLKIMRGERGASLPEPLRKMLEGDGDLPKIATKSPIGANIDRYRKECGWSKAKLAEKMKVERTLIIGHIKGKGVSAFNMKNYADVFSKQLNRQVSVADLESSDRK
jgi:DNA-binding XRE family transcriptional regulator